MRLSLFWYVPAGRTPLSSRSYFNTHSLAVVLASRNFRLFTTSVCILITIHEIDEFVQIKRQLTQQNKGK